MSAKELHLLDLERAAWQTPAARAHAAACADCARLLEADALLGPPEASRVEAPDDAASLGAALRELATQPVAPSWRRDLGRLWALQGAVLGLAALGWASGLLRFGNPAPAVLVWSLAGAIALMGLTTAWLAIAPRARRPWWLIGAGALLLGAAVSFGGSGLEVRPLARGLASCLGLLTLLSVPTLLGGLVLLRRSGVDWRRAAALGLGAAAAALLVLHLHCPEGTVAHLALAHVLPWLGFAGLAAWVRGRMVTSGHAP